MLGSFCHWTGLRGNLGLKSGFLPQNWLVFFTCTLSLQAIHSGRLGHINNVGNQYTPESHGGTQELRISQGTHKKYHVFPCMFCLGIRGGVWLWCWTPPFTSYIMINQSHIGGTFQCPYMKKSFPDYFIQSQ